MGIVVIHYRLTVIPMSQSAQWNVIIRVLNVAQLMSNIFFSNKKSNFAVSGCRERFARTARLACRVSTLGGGRKESSNIGAQYCAFDSQGYDAAAALQRRREPSLLCTVEAVEAGYLWLFMVISSCCGPKNCSMTCWWRFQKYIMINACQGLVACHEFKNNGICSVGRV